MEFLPEGSARVPWHDAASHVFPYAARVGGRWLVLRLNGFPDHPLYTLFADARPVADVEDPPGAWGLHPRKALPALTAADRAAVLALMAGLGPYGAEAGAPCDGDYCGCAAWDDAFTAVRA
ncbi:hypothetical protein ACFVZ8_28840 [Streptomyces sp. NPDC059558]|uniref:hypothetical protein n=1 Tax=Streptomyces sp. NPDC059558 TaxID=3346864 RepID=UPI0036AB592F